MKKTNKKLIKKTNKKKTTKKKTTKKKMLLKNLKKIVLEDIEYLEPDYNKKEFLDFLNKNLKNYKNKYERLGYNEGEISKVILEDYPF